MSWNYGAITIKDADGNTAYHGQTFEGVEAAAKKIEEWNNYCKEVGVKGIELHISVEIIEEEDK